MDGADDDDDDDGDAGGGGRRFGLCGILLLLLLIAASLLGAAPPGAPTATIHEQPASASADGQPAAEEPSAALVTAEHPYCGASAAPSAPLPSSVVSLSLPVPLGATGRSGTGRHAGPASSHPQLA